MDLLVNVDVDDLHEAVRFYGEAFGLTGSHIATAVMRALDARGVR